MKIISELELKKDNFFSNYPLDDDIVITKKDKPFAVVIDFKKYKDIILENDNKNSWIEQTFGIMNNDEAGDLLQNIYHNRNNKKL